LPKKPDAVAVQVIKEMFEASVDGQAYDTERWGAYFRPAGVSAPAGSADSTPAPQAVFAAAAPAPAPRTAPAPAASDFDEDEPAARTAPVSAPATKSPNAVDILAQIRARQQK
jgi:hypothetical protein